MKQRSGRIPSGYAPAPLYGMRYGDIPGINEDYDTFELILTTGGEVYYDPYVFNGEFFPKVPSDDRLMEGSVCRIVLDAGAAATFTATNLGTKRVGSDDFTVSKQNELLVFVFPDGTDGALVKSYTIKVLN